MWRPLATWLHGFGPASLGSVGLASRAAETACGLTRSVLPWSSGSGGSQPLAEHPSSRSGSLVFPRTVWSVSQEALLGAALAGLLTGLRWAADGAFCPATPGVEGGGEGTGAFMFHLLSLCPPPVSPLFAQGAGQLPVTLILKEAETKAGEGNAVKRRGRGWGSGQWGAPCVGSQRI